MRIIIVGAGEVGTNLAKILLEEEQDVVIIDNDPQKIAAVSELMDVQALVGHGSHPDILEAAGAHKADMIIAVTASDEVNMVACQMAYSLYNIQTKIARVRDDAYRRVTAHRLYNRDHMPVDVIISPGLEIANVISRTLAVPGAFEVEDYLGGNLQMVGCRVQARATACGDTIEALEKKFQALRVLAIFRRERLLIPKEDDHVEKDDEVFFMALRENTPEIMQLLGYEARPNKNVFVIGGGHIGYNVCRNLESMGYRPKVLEGHRARAEWLANNLDNTTVLHGDALDQMLLEQEQVGQMGAVVCITSDDATNMLASIMVRDMGAENIMSLVNKSSFVPLVASLGLERVISPGDITSSRILKHLRMGQVHSVHSLKEGAAEVIEARLSKESPLAGLHVHDISLPTGVRLGGVITGHTVANLSENTILHAGDTVILVAHDDAIHLAEGLL